MSEQFPPMSILEWLLFAFIVFICTVVVCVAIWVNELVGDDGDEDPKDDDPTGQWDDFH